MPQQGTYNAKDVKIIILKDSEMFLPKLIQIPPGARSS